MQIDTLMPRIGEDIGKTQTAITSSFRKILRSCFGKFGIKHLLNTVSGFDGKIALLCSAIRSRHIIEFYYHDVCHTVEPFCLGTLLSAYDNVTLLCYRIGGHGEVHGAFGWKLYRLSEMKHIRVLDERFSGVRENYDSHKTSMVTVYCSMLSPAEASAGVLGKNTPSHEESMRRFRSGHATPRKN